MTGVILQGNSLERLREVPDNSVHCVVTSPPYYGLRDYGTGTWTGGDADCDHVSHRIRTGDGLAAFSENLKGGGHKAGSPDKVVRFTSECGKCSAVREDQQLGMEQSPEEYVANMVALFREVRRVLRHDGTLWLNLGDSYAANGGGAPGDTIGSDGYTRSNRRERQRARASVGNGLKHKDLIGIPWMVAFALRADGWYLRQEIIWNKPNPMPESVRDRCTKAHEQIFLLTKSRRYFYDAEAVKEPMAETSLARVAQPNLENQAGSARANGGRKTNGNIKPASDFVSGKRNKRSVWTVSTKPFKEAHFATFPTDLVEPCIQAGTSEAGVCAKCGAPWQRIIERGEPLLEWQKACGGDAEGQYDGQAVKDYTGTGAQNASDVKRRILDGMRERSYRWEPTCECNARTVKPVVLDPFFGAGTTGLVAEQLGRNYLGCELNPEYVAIAKRRLAAAMVPTKRAARQVVTLSLAL